jgi:osmoprotectant transport system permease protein
MTYILQNPHRVLGLLLQHLQMTGLAVLLAVAIAVPLVLLLTRYSWLRLPILSVLGTLYTIPSLALIILLVPWLGLNAQSVIGAMVIYNQVILVRSLSVAIDSVPAAVLEAARGMGMNAWQCWWWVQVPLMMPIFLAGVRLATIVSVAIATIGAKFGAGGLGTLLFEGIAQAGRSDKIWAGALLVSLVAFGLNGLLHVMEQWHRPRARSQDGRNA